jgi:hypothetical protein
LGLPGLFARNFVKGRDVDLDSSHLPDACVSHTVHITGTDSASSDQGFAH